MEDIKDFLLTSEDIAAAKEQKIRPDRTTEYTYSVEASTDTDIVIRKVSKTGKSITKLVLLMSKGMYYILKSNGKSENLTKLNIRNFFRQYPKKEFKTEHPIWDSFVVGDYYRREYTEQSILFMTQSEKFYTGLSNSFVPLSHCSRIVSYEGYYTENPYARYKKSAIEEKLLILNSEIGRYVIQKIMEKEKMAKGDVLYAFTRDFVNSVIYSEKDTYQWKYSFEQVKCFYNIWQIWPADATKFVDLWIASEDFSLSSDCIAHVVFAWYMDVITSSSKTVELMDDYIHGREGMAYPFYQEADKFIHFLFEGPKKYYMDDRLIKWCGLWCQDLSMQKDLYGEIKEPYPEELPFHVLKLFRMCREKKNEE